jgi:hypothetical protein
MLSQRSATGRIPVPAYVVLPYPRFPPPVDTSVVNEFSWVEASDWLRSADAGRYGALVSDHMVTVRRNRLDAARDWLLSGGSVLFFGPPEAGKSAALDVLVASAPGARVLRGDPVRADGEPYGVLAQLLSTVTEQELASVVATDRDVLDAIRGRFGGRGPLPEPGAVRRAVLHLVRSMSQYQSPLLVVDDLERLDEATAEVLRCVATRAEELTIRMAAAERVTDNVMPKGRGLCPSPLLAVRLDALM